MPVIKNAIAESMTRDAIVLDLGDLNRHAEAIVAKAQTEAEAILAAAKAQADALVAGASERGYQAGLEDGRGAGAEQGRADAHKEALAARTAEIDQLVQAWNGALENWEKERTDLFLRAREDVLIFALDVARRVVRRVVDIDPRIAAESVSAALELVREPTSINVLVHPDDAELLRDMLPGLIEGCAATIDMQVREDESVDRGGCVVRTRNGRVDARIKTQFDRIVQALLPTDPTRTFEVEHAPDNMGEQTQ